MTEVETILAVTREQVGKARPEKKLTRCIIKAANIAGTRVALKNFLLTPPRDREVGR